MSLTGALEAFPLEEVLHLLSRSEKSGALRVRGSSLEAKLYLLEGACTYATTRADDNFTADLVQAGLIEDADWRKIERQEAAIADYLAEGVTEELLTDFIADRIHEVLYQLLRLERGTFEFVPEVQPRHTTGQKLPVDLCLEEARSRLAEWREIEEVIPDMRMPLLMSPDLDGEEDVLVDAASWQVLAALQGRASVLEVAERLGRTEFQAAKTLSRLVRQGLVRLAGETSPTRQERAEPVDEEAPKTELRLVDEAAEEQGEEPDVAVEADVEDEEEGDEASLLRVALSEVVNPAEEGEEQAPVMKRRGLGAIAREWRDE